MNGQFIMTILEYGWNKNVSAIPSQLEHTHFIYMISEKIKRV